MASLSAAAPQSQHGTTAAHRRHFHSEPFTGSAIRLQLGQSAASGAGAVPSPAPPFEPLGPSAVPLVGPSSASSQQHSLLLNHFLLSSAPSTSSSSLLHSFGPPSSLRQPFHSHPSHWLTLEGMAPLTTTQFPPAEKFVDTSQPLAEKQQQHYSVNSEASSFSLSSFGSGDSDGRSCSSGSCSGTTHQPQNVLQRTPTEQNANDERIQKAPSATQNPPEPNSQQKPKKSLVRDEAYWERRRKNNDAAKRSRDSRRKKEDEVAVRAVVLEQENLQLRFEVERLRTEIERHRIVAFNDALIAAANSENALEVAMGKVPISSAAMAQLTTAATAIGIGKPTIVKP